VAERVRKIGERTLTSISDVARHQSIGDSDAPSVAAQAMLSELRDDNVALVAILRVAKELASQAGDNATDSLIDDWTDQAEQRAWFLNETLGE
jgi:starvation-inducible DNA-binding protein